MEKDIPDSYKTVNEKFSGELIIKKSKFIASVFHLDDILEVNFHLQNIKKKYHDARHHPYAYRLGIGNNIFKFNDDGEPAGSSGKPILAAIDKFKVTDILIVVTRYFGGVKLGVGGLKRAYFDSAEACLKKSMIIEKFLCDNYEISFDYSFVNSVMKYLEINKIKIIENSFGLKVNLKCELRKSLSITFEDNIKNLTNGKAIIKKIY